jgi:23S rRNA pseudouridine1911/1915/1917 synthase
MSEPATSVEVEIPPEMEGWRVDRALAVLIPTLSRERIKALISTGQVTLSGALARDPAVKARAGGRYILLIPEPAAAHNEAQDIALDIVYEDEHLLVVNNAAGLVVHPAAGNFDGTLVNALLHHCKGSLSGIGGVARPGIVHRIDKDTSGLLVVAKTDPAHVGLAAQFAKHSINRRYAAIVAGRPTTSQGTVNAPLARSSTNRKKIAIVGEGRGKSAITHWTLKEPLRDAALVECQLETGRTHQIRVHMASIGHPLVGDPVYGRARSSHRLILTQLAFARQALHAAELGFIHPISGEALNFNAPIPFDMQHLLSALRANKVQ